MFEEVVFATSDSVESDYDVCLNKLKLGYARKLFFSLLASEEYLDSDTIEQLNSRASMARLCAIMHVDYSIAAHANEFFGSSQVLTQSKAMIQIVMNMLKKIPGFQAYFVSDLLFRAKTTLSWLAGD